MTQRERPRHRPKRPTRRWTRHLPVLTVTTHSGTVPGDLVVGIVYIGAEDAIEAPPGWTRLRSLI